MVAVLFIHSEDSSVRYVSPGTAMKWVIVNSEPLKRINF
jgi:hypothetical protein